MNNPVQKTAQPDLYRRQAQVIHDQDVPHVLSRQLGNRIGLKIGHQGLAVYFTNIGATDHFFQAVYARMEGLCIYPFVPNGLFYAGIVAGFQIDDHLPGRFVIAHIKARATNDADDRTTKLIGRRREECRRIVYQGHRFDPVQAAPDEGVTQHSVHIVTFRALDGNFLGPAGKERIVQIPLLYAKGKGMAQIERAVAAGRFAHTVSNKVK